MKRTVRVYDREFAQFSRQAIHPKVSQLLQQLPRGSVLDMPAGSGALSYRLHKEGFSVTACDIHPEHFEPPEIPVHYGDLRRPFPFPDSSFDYAMFVEGPEHAENPFWAIREFARVLKPGGRLLLTIPNYSNIERRLKLLFYGSGEKAVSPQRLHGEFGGDPAMLHISPLLYPQLKFFLEASGFTIELIEKDTLKKRQLLLYPLVLLIQGFSKILGERGREKYWLDEVNSNAVLLGGNTLIILARLVSKATTQCA